MIKIGTASGKAIHPIGIGTWGMGGTWEANKNNEKKSLEAIRYSISKKQNHIDSGEIYGGGYTDKIIGKAIRGFNRKDLFIADKLWETSVGKGRVRPAVERMLKKLGTDYLDILYIHKAWDDWPWEEAIEQINELIDKKIVRFFGVSNFTLTQMKKAMKISKYPIVANQLYYNVLHRQDAPKELEDFCRDKNIRVIAYKPLERGAVIENKVVKSIAATHDAAAAQIALAWLLAKNAWPIPKAMTKNLIDENIGAIRIRLPPDEIDRLDKILL